MTLKYNNTTTEVAWQLFVTKWKCPAVVELFQPPDRWNEQQVLHNKPNNQEYTAN
jgi:hypothetical protein